MRHIFAIFLSIVLAASAGFAQKTVEQIVARVNGDIILKSELDSALKTLRADLSQQGVQGAQLEQAVVEQSRHMLRKLIDDLLIVQQAKDMGLNADLEVIKTLERMRQENKLASMDDLEKAIVQQGYTVDEIKQNIRNQTLRSQVLSREVYHKIVVTTEELRNYYEANKKDFDRPEGVRIFEIAISTENKTPQEVEAQRKKAEEALAAIQKGDDFRDVAQKYSESQSAQSGGDLGFFEKGQLSEAYQNAVGRLEKGQVTEALTMPYGFAIFKLEDKHAGGILPFEIAQNDIQELLFQQRVQPKIREYLTKLRVDGFVEVREGYEDTGAPSKSAKVSEVKPEKK